MPWFSRSIVDGIGIVIHGYLTRFGVEMKIRGDISDLSSRVNIEPIGNNLSVVVFGYRMYYSKFGIISMVQDTCRAKIVVKTEHVVLAFEVGAEGYLGSRRRQKLRDMQYVKQYYILCSIPYQVILNTNS